MDYSVQTITGLAFAPGVMLLILSSAFRYQTLENQVARLSADHQPISPTVARLLTRRARRFQIAFVSLYAAVAILFLAVAGPILLQLLSFQASFDLAPLLLAALALVLVAIFQLIMEGRHCAVTLTRQIGELKTEVMPEKKARNEIAAKPNLVEGQTS